VAGYGRHGGAHGFQRGLAFRNQLRQPEIQDLGLTPVGDKEVCGFDVTMEDMLPVGGVERVGDLNGDVEQLVEGEGPAG